MSGISSGSWVAYSLIFEADRDNIHSIYIRKNTATAGTMLFDSISIYEVTPGYVVTTNLAPDGWGKDTTSRIYREHNGTNTKDGSFYAIKLTALGGVSQLYWGFPAQYTNLDFCRKFAGRTITFGVWVKASDANSSRLSIYDGSATYSEFHTGGGTYEWLEVTKTISSSVTSFFIWMNCADTKTAYFSQPMLVFGSSIGEGNYQPIPNEVIPLQTSVLSKLLISGLSDVSATILNIEADSNGMIGKGIKATKITVGIFDTGSAAGAPYMYISPDPSTKRYDFLVGCCGLANSKSGYGIGWVNTSVTGDLYYFIDASGTGTFAIGLFEYQAIQT